MSANIEGMLNEAQREIDAGRKDAAMTLLLRVTELDERNERAWLLLAMAVDSEEEKRTCLDNVLIINPNNAEALRVLDELDRVEDNEILAGDDPFGFDAPDAAEDAPPFTAAPTFDPPPTSSSSSFDGPFGMEEEEDPPAPVSRRPAAEVRSGGGLGDVYEDESIGNEYDYDDDSLSGDYDYDYGDDGYDDDYDDYDDAPADEADDFLGMIPDDIRPTRSPGMDETPNSSLMIGVWVLGVLNVLGIGLLVLQFLG